MHAHHLKKKRVSWESTSGIFSLSDPRVEVTNGFFRSRFLDDKACVAALAAAIKSLAESGQNPAQDVTFLISNLRKSVTARRRNSIGNAGAGYG